MSSQFNSATWGGFGSAGSVQSTTARGLIYKALRALTVLRSGQTASDDVIDDSLNALNDLLDSWNTERLTCPALSRSEYVLTVGDSRYEFGRPMRIEHASILGTDTEYEVKLLSSGQWSRGENGIYNDNSFPLATFYVRPAPAVADTLVLYTWEPFPGFNDLDTEYSFPPGYIQALKFGLAHTIAPMHVYLMKSPNAMLASIEKQAMDSKAKLLSLNAPITVMQCDPAIVGPLGFDIYSGR